MGAILGFLLLAVSVVLLIVLYKYYLKNKHGENNEDGPRKLRRST
jgi:hypothetical protein